MHDAPRFSNIPQHFVGAKVFTPDKPIPKDTTISVRLPTASYLCAFFEVDCTVCIT